MMDLFITNPQLFASQGVNWWTGVILITLDNYDALISFLSIQFNQIILTAHIHCRGSAGEQVI